MNVRIPLAVFHPLQHSVTPSLAEFATLSFDELGPPANIASLSTICTEGYCDPSRGNARDCPDGARGKVLDGWISSWDKVLTELQHTSQQQEEGCNIKRTGASYRRDKDEAR